MQKINFENLSKLYKEHKTLIQKTNSEISRDKESEIEEAKKKIEQKYTKLKEAKEASINDTYAEQILNFIRQCHKRFQECLVCLDEKKDKDLELELLEISKEVGKFFFLKKALFEKSKFYDYFDKEKDSFKKIGIKNELKDLQDLIKNTWFEREKRRKRLFGVDILTKYQPWFVFLSNLPQKKF